MGFFYSNPPETKDVPLRPLSKGMRRDIPSTSLAIGEFFDLKNLFATTNGLRRRNAMSSYLGGSSVVHPSIQLMDTIWRTDGIQSAVLLDSKMPYYITSSLNLVKSTYVVGTVTGALVGGVTRLTGAGGTLWATAASDVKVGDVFYCANLTGPRKWGIIDKINTDTQIDLTTNEGTAAAVSAYEIQRSIWTSASRFPDAASVDGNWIMVDGRRKPRVYNPVTSLTTFTNWSAHATFDLWPGCICYFKDRLFFGRIIETAGTEDNRTRIRWTTTLDFSVLPGLQFLDLPYSAGFIRRLIGMENTLLCYMNDAIWIGRLTNYSDQLPVAFDTKLETGGIGLVGDRAVLPYLGGHFFVGDDNIYFLSSGMQLEAIGDPIKELFFTDPDALWSIKVEADPENTRLLFTEPSVTGGFSKIFSFDYRAKAWSYEENIGSFIGRKQITRGFTYDTWLSAPPYTYDTGLGIFTSYDIMGTPDLPRIYIGYESGLRFYAGPAVLTDVFPSGAISVSIESGDFDYSDPDTEKIHLRISVKIKEKLPENLTFNVLTSNDEGNTWKQTTGRPLVIEAGELENFVNFRTRGSTFRFKLLSSSQCSSWIVKEIVLKVAGAGVETHLASNR